ncbi:MAG TPA: MucR family transcriptional regulator [Syntrophobacteraceae bacterium]|nr:MucR family transcriptional regulator [Syntrophobacteraceae bacterium]
MPKKLIEIASEIVQTQASLTSMTAAEISSSLRQVFTTLKELQGAECGEIALPKTQESAPAKALKPEDSIQNDRVICLECGAAMTQLTPKHLTFHGMNPTEYRKKYGFKMRMPLAAKSLTRARSKRAKKRGLPENLKKYMEARRQEKARAAKPAAPETAAAGTPVAVEAIRKGLREKPALKPQNSIQEDKVICLECGAEMKWLTQKHLVIHGISTKEYRKKYGFSMQTPLAAKSLTKDWSKAAKKRGLPENLRKAMDAKRQAKAEAEAHAASETATARKPNRTKLRKKKVS